MQTKAYNHTFVWEYNGDAVRGEFWDSAGQEEYRHLRALSYHGSNVVLVGFSLVDPPTLENIVCENGWVDELVKHLPGFNAMVLLGLKHDIWDKSNLEHCQESRIHQVWIWCCWDLTAEAGGWGNTSQESDVHLDILRAQLRGIANIY